jgi:hypothetical protein
VPWLTVAVAGAAFPVDPALAADSGPGLDVGATGLASPVTVDAGALPLFPGVLPLFPGALLLLPGALPLFPGVFAPATAPGAGRSTLRPGGEPPLPTPFETVAVGVRVTPCPIPLLVAGDPAHGGGP